MDNMDNKKLEQAESPLLFRSAALNVRQSSGWQQLADFREGIDSVALEDFIRSKGVRQPHKLSEAIRIRYICAFMVGNRLDEVYQRFLDDIDTSPDFAKFFSSSKHRSRLMAYFFQTALRNCMGTDFQQAENLMSFLGTFDYEEEILSSGKQWLIPMTGSLYNDIRTNWVAKCGVKLSKEEAKAFIYQCLDTIRSQFVDSIISGFKVRAFLPVIMLADEDPARLNDFLSGFKDESIYVQRKAEAKRNLKDMDWLGSELCRQLAYKTLLPYAGDTPLYVDPAPYSVGVWDGSSSLDSRLFATPGVGAIDATFVEPDKAQKSDLLTSILPCVSGRDSIMEQVSQRLKSNNGPNFDPCASILDAYLDSPTTSMRVAISLLLSPIFQRERLEYHEMRKTLIEKRKNAEKYISIPRGEWEAQKRNLVDAEQIRHEINETKNALADAGRDISAKKEKIKNQAERIKATESNLLVLKRENSQLQAENFRLTKQLSELEAENLRIKNLLKKKEQELLGEEDDTEDIDISDTSIFDSLNIVCVGGHPNWANNMKTLHKNVRVFGFEGPEASEEVIGNADALWMQINFISHSLSEKMVAFAKQKNVPICYFRQAGHIQCKKQLIQETTEMFGVDSIMRAFDEMLAL